MTIISFGDKLKKPGEEPLVTAEQTANALVGGKDVEVGVRTASLRISTSRKTHPLATLFLFVLGMMVLCMGIFAGLYCYQYWSHKPTFIPIQRIRGMFSMTGNDAENRQFLTFDHVSLSPRQKFTFDTHHGLVTENIDTHPKYERLEVPSFNGSNRGVFVHDFEANLTAIVDTHNCYVMPLNRNQVMPPASLADFLIKNNQGYYNVDTDIVRETMRVVLPPMSSFNFGGPIMQECSRKRVYQLEKNTSHVLKRSAGEYALFRVYAGKPMEVAIVNYKEAMESDS